MEKKLFLSSMAVGIDGLLKQFSPLENGENKSIVLIPTVGSDGYSYFPQPGETERRHKYLFSRGFKVIPVRPELLSPESFQNRILDWANGLFVEGGDPWHLMETFRRLQLGQFLTKLFAKGGFYMGASAGSMIAGTSMELASYHPNGGKDPKQDNNHDGLKLIDSNIWPHYRSEHKNIIDKLPRSLLRENLIRLYDNQAVIAFDDAQTTIIEVTPTSFQK